MNTVSKAALLVVSSFLFVPVHAQTGNISEDQQMQRHMQEIERITEQRLKSEGLSDAEIKARLERQSQNVNKNANQVRALVREQIKRDHPNYTEEELNRETNAVISEGIQLFGQFSSRSRE